MKQKTRNTDNSCARYDPSTVVILRTCVRHPRGFSAKASVGCPRCQKCGVPIHCHTARFRGFWEQRGARLDFEVYSYSTGESSALSTKKKPSQGCHHAPHLRQARERPQGMSILRKLHPSSHKNSGQRSSSPSAHPNLSSKPSTTSSKFSNRKQPPSKDNANNSDIYLENDSSRLPSTSLSLSSPSLLISVSLSTARLMPNPVFLFSSLLLRPPISVPSRGY